MGFKICGDNVQILAQTALAQFMLRILVACTLPTESARITSDADGAFIQETKLCDGIADGRRGVWLG